MLLKFLLDIVKASSVTVFGGDAHHSLLLLLFLLLVQTLVIEPSNFFRLVVIHTEIIKALVISSGVLKDPLVVI